MGESRPRTAPGSVGRTADPGIPSPASGQLNSRADGPEARAIPGQAHGGDGPVPTVPGPSADPFDPARLRLSQDFGADLGIRRVLNRVPVDKPNKAWWVRTHPDEAFRLQTGLLELKEERERYLVNPSLWGALATEPAFYPAILITSISRQGVVFLWPIRLPGPDGRANPWHQSAFDAAERARSAWVRVYADMALGAYSCDESTAIRDEPEWPSEPLRELLRIAFRDRFIAEWGHPVLKQLRGEA